MKLKKLMAGILAIMCMSASLSGCSITAKKGAEGLELVRPVTKDEVVKYYNKAMSFDVLATKNIDIDKTLYELRPVENDETKALIGTYLNKTQDMLKKMEYVYNADDEQYLNENTYHYVKGYLNDMELTNPNVLNIRQALGYYFVDVEYTMKSRPEGTFTPCASLVGLEGAFKHSEYYDSDEIDVEYLQMAVSKLNEYYEKERINRVAYYDESTGLFKVYVDFVNPFIGSGIQYSGKKYLNTDSNDIAPVVPENDSANNGTDVVKVNNTQQIGVSEVTVTKDKKPENVTIVPSPNNKVQENTDNTTPENTEEVENTEVNENTVDGNTTFNEIAIRQNSVDVREFNNIVGVSTKRSAYMPHIEIVYNVPAETEGISGIGMAPSGIGGLQIFGFNRENIEGTLKLRYVYKEDLNNPTHLTNTNIYPVFGEVVTGTDQTSESVVPEFVQDKIKSVIEQSDRAIANNDLPALMNGHIYQDIGYGMLRGYISRNTNRIRYISTLRRIISRDVEKNAYLCEVETQVQEGPKGANVYGTYRNTYYVVVEQIGQDFVITDSLNVLREMQEEPDINPDSAVEKRIAALNLAGDVKESEKEKTLGLMSDYYRALTAGIGYLENPPTEFNGEVYNRGVNQCFNTDNTMLSSNKRERLISKIVGLMYKFGTTGPFKIDGVVTKWIGGADNQVEFTTEELITYPGRDTAVYLECYYLVSNMNDVWVIDDIQVLQQEERTGQAIKTDMDRIYNKQNVEE